MEIQVLYEITKIFIEEIRYFIVIRNNAMIFYQKLCFPSFELWFFREGWFYSFPQLFVVYNAFGIQIWEVTSFCFLRSLTHLILFLLYTFRSSSDLLFRNLFLNFDLTMIAFLSSLFINDACLALTYFFLRGAKLFKDFK